MWTSVSVSIRRCVRTECAWTTSPDTTATAPVDTFTTARCWSVSVRTTHTPAAREHRRSESIRNRSNRSVSCKMNPPVCLPLHLSVCLSTCLSVSDHDECEEESCVGGVCVNTVGSYYCSCQLPLMLDDTQRNCVNSSHLTVGKTPAFLLLLSPTLLSHSSFIPLLLISFTYLISLFVDPPDENLSVCWQQVTADLVCQSPLLGAQVTFMDCCCLYGEGWGMECALCPATDTGKYLTGRTSPKTPTCAGQSTQTEVIKTALSDL